MRTISYFIDERGKKAPDKIYAIAPEPGLSLSYGQLQKTQSGLESIWRRWD